MTRDDGNASEWEHVRPVGTDELTCPWCGGIYKDEADTSGRFVGLTLPSLDHVQWVHNACEAIHGTPSAGQRWRSH